jgi:predicted enzyme related to lactoylglutathione lyase
MDSQVKFYKENFGLQVLIPGEQDSYANEFWVEFDTGEASLCLHDGGIQDFGNDAPMFTFEVTDINRTKKFLEETKIKHGEIISPVPDHYYIDCYDPEGNKFSLEQFRNYL